MGRIVKSGVNNIVSVLKTENQKSAEKVKSTLKDKVEYFWKWPLKVLVFTFCITIVFSVVSEVITSKAGYLLSALVIIVFILVNILFDIVGVAITTCSIENFEPLLEKNDKSVKICVMLVKNAEKVSSFCCDIIGDIAGILSGSASAAIMAKFTIDFGISETIVVSTLFASIIAAVTVFAKAIGKRFAINHSVSIIYKVGKFLSFFGGKGAKRK